MHNKISTGLGTMLLIIIALTVVIFVWTYEKGQDWSAVTIQTPVLNDGQKDSMVEVAVTEPMSEWKTYQDKEYGFEFRYPKAFDVKITDHYSVSDFSGEKARISVKKWKGYTIPKNTAGTFWEELAYVRWQYFSDNMRSIPPGTCSDEALAQVPGPTAGDLPQLCTVSKQGNLLKIETEDRIMYFTEDLEIQWEFNRDNKDLAKKMASTFVLK